MSIGKFVCGLAFVLLVIGGLNWGLVGLFGFNVVQYLFGSFPYVAQVIYVLVGVSAVYVAFMARRCKCKKEE